jgi:hypothetical protein
MELSPGVWLHLRGKVKQQYFDEEILRMRPEMTCSVGIWLVVTGHMVTWLVVTWPVVTWHVVTWHVVTWKMTFSVLRGFCVGPCLMK